MAVSPLVTRGMGSTPMLVTRGFGAVAVVAEAIARRLRHGRSRAKDLYEDKFHRYFVKVMLTSVNDKDLVNPITNEIIKVVEEKPGLIFKISEITVRYLKLPAKRIIISVQKIIRGGKK